MNKNDIIIFRAEKLTLEPFFDYEQKIKCNKDYVKFY